MARAQRRTIGLELSYVQNGKEAALEPVFIVGQYKCGTSWLLSALSAHPDVIGVGEIDVVRAACDIRDGSPELAPERERLERFFGRTAWCSANTVDALEQGLAEPPRRSDLSRPQVFRDLEPRVALELYRQIKSASHPWQATEAFLEAVGAAAQHQTHLVLKGADQIKLFAVLRSWRPEAKKVVITRDGRDAAISAIHYRKLVENAPWFGGHQSYELLLTGWRSRARWIIEEARQGSLHLLRYEDLTLDFETTFTSLLDWLGLDGAPALVGTINRTTRFEVKTGRPRGSDGTGILRKGAIREWLETLGEEEKAAAWELAGAELTALGYGKDGEIHPLDPAFILNPSSTR